MSGERRDWRETGRVAADLAVLGLLVAAAALPVVTAGAAVATGSAAVHHYLEHDRWPDVRFCWRVFRRRLLPGFVMMLACALAAALVAVDFRALDAGRVPGGPLLMAVTGAVAAIAIGYLAVLVVAAGTGRVAVRVTTAPPATVAAMAGVVTIATLLALLVHPVLTPVLAGYTLFALHVVARRPDRRRSKVGVARAED